jgi:hypothetical protein
LRNVSYAPSPPYGANGSGNGQEIVRHGGGRRYPVPAQLPGATAFSKQGELKSSRWLFEAIERTPWIAEAIEAVAIDRNWGRRREPGNWPWLFLDFVMSDSIDMQAWYGRTDPSLWERAGFRRKLSYQVTYERFAELEERWPQFEAAAGLLIRNARRQDPNVGMYVHTDSTEAETHAAFVHDCSVADDCPWALQDARRRARRERRRRELAEGEEPPQMLDLDELDTHH